MALKDCFRAYHFKTQQQPHAAGKGEETASRHSRATSGNTTRSRMRPNKSVNTGNAAGAHGADKARASNKANSKLALATKLKPKAAIFEGVGDGSDFGDHLRAVRAHKEKTKSGGTSRAQASLARAQRMRRSALADFHMPYVHVLPVLARP